MKITRRWAVRMVSCAAVLLASSGCEKPADKKPETAAGGTPASLRIAVVPKGTTHEYWQSIHAGAKQAERELQGVEITFRGPQKEDDRDQQVSLVETLVSSRYDAIVLAPLDSRALLAPVKLAAAAKIPVVIMDSGLDGKVGEDFVSYIATDNKAGGAMAGKKLGELMGGKGKVLLLRYQEGSASTALREEGFVEAIRGFPGIELIDPKRYAGATRETAQQAAENLLTTNSDIGGVFCPNESSTYGMLLALRARNMAGKVPFIGFDSARELVDALAAGEVSALTVQNPIRMGYLAVKAAVDHLRGQPVEPMMDTGVALITKDTMNTPEHKNLLSPDLKSLLGTP